MMVRCTNFHVLCIYYAGELVNLELGSMPKP